MKKTKYVVIYSNKNISKYFLSPYVNFLFNEESLIINQWLFKKTISIKCNPEKMNVLLEKLSKGLTFQELNSNMKKIFKKNSNMVIKNFMKNGIIE